jgi:transcription elongation factor
MLYGGPSLGYPQEDIMHPAYKDDKELCEWLRGNSSGSYKLSGYAAERIETLTQHLENVNKECDKLEKMLASEEMLTVINTAIGTAVSIVNMTDDETVQVMAANVADSLISLTNVPDL